MNAYKSNLLYAVLLIFLSIWEYNSALNPSIVYLIPLFFGVVLLSLNDGVKYALKGQTTAALFLNSLSIATNILIFYGLYPDIGMHSLLRYVLMVIFGLIAIFYLHKSSNFKS